MTEKKTIRIVGAPYPGPRSSPPPANRRRVRGLLLHLVSGTAWRVCHAAVLWMAAEAILVAKGGAS